MMQVLWWLLWFWLRKVPCLASLANIMCFSWRVSLLPIQLHHEVQFCLPLAFQTTGCNAAFNIFVGIVFASTLVGSKFGLVDSRLGPWTRSQAGLVSCLEPWKNIIQHFVGVLVLECVY